MKSNTLLKLGRTLLIGSFLAFSALSLQACNDQAKEVKTLKSNCQMKKCGTSMKCKDGKCGTAKAAKFNSGKCGDTKEEAKVMKCQPGKCAVGKCGQGK